MDWDAGRVWLHCRAQTRPFTFQCKWFVPAFLYAVLRSAKPHTLGRRNGESGCRSPPLVVHLLEIAPELTNTGVAKLQDGDEVLGPVKSMLSQGYSPTLDDLRALPLEGRKLWYLRPTIILQNQVLVRRDGDAVQLVVPQSLRRQLFTHTHAGPLAAHLGSQRMLAQLRRLYYWPGMRKDIDAWCRQCEGCAISRGPPNRPHGHLRKVSAGAPMDLVAIDIPSGLPATVDGYRYLLLATDYFTKWLEAIPLCDAEAQRCMRALYSAFFSRFSLPRQLHSDQGSNFESKLVAKLCSIAGINKTDVGGISYDAALSDGHQPQHGHDAARSLATDFSHSAAAGGARRSHNLFRGRFSPKHAHAHAAGRAAKTQKNYFDKHVKGPPFALNQFVWLYWPHPLLRSRFRKLTRSWTVHWRIVEFKTTVVVVVQNVKTHKKQTVHVDRLVPCVADCTTRPKKQWFLHRIACVAAPADLHDCRTMT